jgi:hypothetical protein
VKDPEFEILEALVCWNFLPFVRKPEVKTDDRTAKWVLRKCTATIVVKKDTCFEHVKIR